jgi:hypothetical protein
MSYVESYPSTHDESRNMAHSNDDYFAAVFGNRRGTSEPLSADELRDRAENAQRGVVQARRWRDKAVIDAVEGGVPLAELPQASIEARRKLGNAGQ